MSTSRLSTSERSPEQHTDPPPTTALIEPSTDKEETP